MSNGLLEAWCFGHRSNVWCQEESIYMRIFIFFCSWSLLIDGQGYEGGGDSIFTGNWVFTTRTNDSVCTSRTKVLKHFRSFFGAD